MTDRFAAPAIRPLPCWPVGGSFAVVHWCRELPSDGPWPGRNCFAQLQKDWALWGHVDFPEALK